MSELKRCPFCGGKAITIAFYALYDLDYMVFEVNDSESIDGEVTCENERCINGWYLSPKDWNTRPIEDALNARIAELESTIERLIEAGKRLLDSLCIDPEEEKTVEVMNWKAVVDKVNKERER